jgi:hypothetical protein
VVWNVGRRTGDTNAAGRRLLGMLVALVVATLGLLLALIYVL